MALSLPPLLATSYKDKDTSHKRIRHDQQIEEVGAQDSAAKIRQTGVLSIVVLWNVYHFLRYSNGVIFSAFLNTLIKYPES